MALRFVLGRAGSGKSYFSLGEIRAEVRQDPLGVPLILLVPEQATYQMELQLAATPDLGGMLRAQVLSFRRLGWRVISESGGGLGVTLGELGKRMLLHRILLQRQGELKVLANSAKRPGMADLLARAIAEFKAYRLRPADLRQAAEDAGGKLGEKLNDLALLYAEFEQVLKEGMQDPDDALSLMAEKLAEAQTTRGAKVWVDGFKGFTPQELRVMERLLSVCSEVTVTLPLDPELPRRGAGDEVLRPGEELFLTPWLTYQALRRLALTQGTEITGIINLQEGKRFKGPWLKHLEKYFTFYPTPVYVQEDEVPVLAPVRAEVRLAAAINRRAEVEGVAREIRRLARDDGRRWHEIAILTRDMPSYAQTIWDIFHEYEIPLFLDYRRTVTHHPLLEFIQSALEVARCNWAFEPVFRCLKTGFFPLSRDAVDCLENYCLEHGLEGRGWTEAEEWHYTSQRVLGEDKGEEGAGLQERMNAARWTVVRLLAPFSERLRAEDRWTVRRLAGEVYALLERMDIPKQLEQWANLSEQTGELDEARLQTQMWDGVISVLDEMVAGLGEESLSLEDFALILASGLESLQLGLIPPALDQVLAGTLERSRNPEVRVLFLLGANEGVLPARPADHGVLAASEREELAAQGLELAPSGQAQGADEQFFLYAALTRAGEQLVLSYSLSDEDGKGMAPSPVVKRLRAIFPRLQEELWGGNVDSWEQISHATPLLPAYALQLSAVGQTGQLPPLWQAVRRWFLEESELSHLMRLLETGALEGRQEENLPQSLTRRLYGRRLRASVSRLEQFNRCPFAHFAHYGLRLRERSVYRLASPDLGQFFHRLLHDFAQTVRREGLDWGSLSQEESWQILSRLTDQVAPELQHEILLSNARYRFLTQKLQKTVHHAVRVLTEHARRGQFVPVSLEVRFGEEGLPSAEIPLAAGNSLVLVGQIDRIDAVYLEGKVYLRILDYKSQEQTLSLERVYYGLSLQLLTYLDVALQGAEVLIQRAGEVPGLEKGGVPCAQPAGFLYFPVVDPMLDSTVPLSAEELEQQRLKAVKVDGYLLANDKVLQAMDQMLVQGQSDLLRLKLTKNGKFRQGAKVLSVEQFDLLRTRLRQVVAKTGEDIMKGEIGIRPVKLGHTTGCQYCDYHPVCHFEEDMPDYRHKSLPRLKTEEIWQRIRTDDSSGAGVGAMGPAVTSAGEVHWLEDLRGDRE